MKLHAGEIVKPIPKWEGRYAATSHGRIISLGRLDSIGRKCHAKALRQAANKSGRLFVVLYDESYGKPFEVHRLVATAFIPKIEGKDHVNHKDGNRQNNQPENLEWCTREENDAHAVANGLTKKGESGYRGVCYHKRTGTSKMWLARIFVNKKQKIIGHFHTAIEAARAFNKFVIENSLPNKLNEVSP